MGNFVSEKTGKIEIQQKGKWHETFGLTPTQVEVFNSLFSHLDELQTHRVSVVFTHVWLSGFGKGAESQDYPLKVS